jgi:1-acyl-sn-glycerol-3-phosphate acyltransferase
VRRFCYWISRTLLRIILGGVSRTRVLHAERGAAPGAWILAANHISHFDPPFLTVATRRKIDWMAVVELFSNRIAGTWLRANDTFPVDRGKVDRAAVRTALDRLARGHVVGMFPEGGIRDGARSVLGGAALRPGIAALAQMSGAPIVPCVLLGSDRLYFPRNWLPLRRVRACIAFGEPLRCEGEGKEARVKLEAAVAENLRALAAEMRAAFQLTDDDFPKPPLERKAGR